MKHEENLSLWLFGIRGLCGKYCPMFSKKRWMHSGECEVEHQGTKHNVVAFQRGGERFGNHQGD